MHACSAFFMHDLNSSSSSELRTMNPQHLSIMFTFFFICLGFQKGYIQLLPISAHICSPIDLLGWSVSMGSLSLSLSHQSANIIGDRTSFPILQHAKRSTHIFVEASY